MFTKSDCHYNSANLVKEPSFSQDAITPSLGTRPQPSRLRDACEKDTSLPSGPSLLRISGTQITKRPRPVPITIFIVWLPLITVFLLTSCSQHRPVYIPRPETPTPSSSPATLPGTQPTPPPRPAPAPSPSFAPGPAHQLWLEAQDSLANKQYRQAEMLLERALRVEPGNGWYYHTLARVHYANGAYGKARQFLLKSDSTAGGNRQLRQQNRYYLEQLGNR